MKKNVSFLLFLIINELCCASNTTIFTVDSKNNAPLQEQQLNAVTLMTAQDLTNNTLSNLNLTNNTSEPITVYGLYLYGVASLNPGINCQDGVEGGNSTTYAGMVGGMASPLPFAARQSIAIGQHYLYQMLYTYLYWHSPSTDSVQQLFCALPGCTWPGDHPNNPTIYNWCIQLGAISPDARFFSKIVPYSWPVTSDFFLYNYELIPSEPPGNYIWIGPFSCNDETLTCSTTTPQYQSFP